MNLRRERFEALRAQLAPLVEEVLTTGEPRCVHVLYVVAWSELGGAIEDVERAIRAVTWGRPIEGYTLCANVHVYVVLRRTR